MFANVAAAGTLLSGTATSARRADESGVYFIDFGTDVSGCAAVASASGNSITWGIVPTIYTADIRMGFPDSHQIGIAWAQVQPFTGGGIAFVDINFYLIVVC